MHFSMVLYVQSILLITIKEAVEECLLDSQSIVKSRRHEHILCKLICLQPTTRYLLHSLQIL